MDSGVRGHGAPQRLELARELHDVVGHHIAGIVIQARSARLVGSKRPEILEGSLSGIESAGSDALAAMRRVVGLLRDTEEVPEPAPGPLRLSDLAGQFAGYGPSVELRLPAGDQPAWPDEVTTTIYRVVQEALTNVVLHAPEAEAVTVTIGDDPSAVVVAIANECAARQGRLIQRSGYGLIGMRERVEALGGTLVAGPYHGGWVVRATVPLPARRTA